MKKVYTIILFLFTSLVLKAQTTKTDVLVVGNNISSVAAAIQAARSGVKTTIIDAGIIGSNISQEELKMLSINPKDIRKPSGKDSLNNNASSKLAGKVMSLKQITDTIKNLTVLNSIAWSGIEKSGKGWEIKYPAGKIKAEFLIDGTENSQLAAKAGLQNGKPQTRFKTIVPFNASNKEVLESKLYRTVAATADGQSRLIRIGAMLPAGEVNILALTNLPQDLKPDMTSYGQAAGGIAAFCSFFNTTTKSLDIRVTQGELLGYGSQLIPFKDVSVKDTNYIALQHIALTGILKVDPALNFHPEGNVSAPEIKAAMKEYYSRSQIWFFRNEQEKMTIGDAINLIMITATRGEELKTEIEKGWKTSLNMKSEFDQKRSVTRREFAVLLDTFLKPFTVRVDLNGNLLN